MGWISDPVNWNNPYGNYSTTECTSQYVTTENGRKGNHTDFDRIIGHIEDMLVDETFYNLQREFLETHWTEFEESEENKHEYMEIYHNYTNAIERYITRELQTKEVNFSMDNFIRDLEERKNELDGEVFDILYTLTDFTAFKDMFLNYKKVKLDGNLDLSQAITVISIRPR